MWNKFANSKKKIIAIFIQMQEKLMELSNKHTQDTHNGQ